MAGRVSNSRANMANRNKGKSGASKRKKRATPKPPIAKKRRKPEGYTARKDKSVAARLGAGPASKRKARRDESYGAYGSTAAKPRGGGRINV